MRGRDRPLISLGGTSLSEFELNSSLSTRAATPRSIDAAMSFRYFTDSLESRFADSITLKSESLAPYATADTFVAFELLGVDARHDGDERSGKAVESHQSRHIASRTRQPSAESTGNADLASVESQAAIGEAEAAIALAQKIVEEADAACALGSSPADTAIVAEASAVSTVAFAAPASSCDAAKPSRQVALSLHSGIKFGLLSMASIVISMRAAESGNHRKRVANEV